MGLLKNQFQHQRNKVNVLIANQTMGGLTACMPVTPDLMADVLHLDSDAASSAAGMPKLSISPRLFLNWGRPTEDSRHPIVLCSSK
jgi:hypothetical protein